MTLFVGTSGWQYKDWREVFYPAEVPMRLWLEEYTEHFATVEINNAFYRLPTRENFEAWRERVPRDFVVAVKASVGARVSPLRTDGPGRCVLAVRPRESFRE